MRWRMTNITVAQIANYAVRQQVKPGITGWAQVNGARGETPTIAHMQARVDLDAWYVENQSLSLDLLVLAKHAAGSAAHTECPLMNAPATCPSRRI
jgi:lipopolysaccharide/colanic/teichoic acid biosynthesis glycosyltransferase